MTFALHDLTDELRAAMLEHAAREAPNECCGLLVSAAGALHYLPGVNLLAGADGDRFRLDSATIVAAEDLGEIVAAVHSHPNASANPSMADRVGCERAQMPYVIVGWPHGVIKLVEPSGWSAPYLGRDFHHGVLDCYTLIQDWYWRELSLELPDFDRDDDWWVDKPDAPARDLYADGFRAAGFVQVSDALRRHDVVVMRLRSKKGNHGGIYIDEGWQAMLHHPYRQLSERVVYGGFWQRQTAMVLRHEQLLGTATMRAAA